MWTRTLELKGTSTETNFVLSPKDVDESIIEETPSNNVSHQSRDVIYPAYFARDINAEKQHAATIRTGMTSHTINSCSWDRLASFDEGAYSGQAEQEGCCPDSALSYPARLQSGV
ncbi:hypothetical protein BD769DRAFT_1637582 [Suillus cothurnatus]|nr:hypothetical protein BD769DRAFT_1637582 [Suillus cothurnatus]